MPPLLQKKRLLSPFLSIPPLLQRARRQTAPLQYALLKRMGSEGGGEKYLPCSTAVVHAEKPFLFLFWFYSAREVTLLQCNSFSRLAHCPFPRWICEGTPPSPARKAGQSLNYELGVGGYIRGKRERGEGTWSFVGASHLITR